MPESLLITQFGVIKSENLPIIIASNRMKYNNVSISISEKTIRIGT